MTDIIDLDERRSIRQMAASLRISPLLCGLCRAPWNKHSDEQMVTCCETLRAMRASAVATTPPLTPSAAIEAVDAIAGLNMTTGRFTPREAEAHARETVEMLIGMGWRR